jgi:hypothetical protein
VKVALIEIDPQNIIEVFNAVPPSVRLPDVGSVSPVEVGWRGGGAIVYVRNEETGKEEAQEGTPRFAIVAVDEAGAPPDGQRVKSLSYELSGGNVIETAIYEKIPEPPALSAAEKLQASGLTVEELKALLGL